MKIQNLRLTAFGPFTGKPIDLSGDTNFHVFYGPNEAGKSSALRAIKALFFGVAGNSSDDFIHKFSDMRLGAKLIHSNGDSLEFIRRKGNKNTFLDLTEKPGDEAVLARYLNGISEQQFESAFGLTHHSLIKGAQELLQAGGNVGEALFSAALGSGNLRKILEDLESEISSLFSASASKPLINKALKEISELQKEIRDGTLSGKEWVEKQSGLEKALLDSGKIKNQIIQKSAEKRHLEKYQVILPKLQQFQTKKADLEALGSVVNLPDDFSVKRTSIQTSLTGAADNLRTLEKDILDDAEMFEKISVRADILAHASEIDALRDAMGSYRTYRRDLPGLESDEKIQLNLAQACIRDLGGDLTLESAISKRPVLARRVRIQALAGQYQSLLKDCALAVSSFISTEKKLQVAKMNIESLGEYFDIDNLEKHLEQVFLLGDMEKSNKGELLKLENEESAIQDGLKRIGLIDMDLQEFSVQSYPSVEALDQFDSRFQESNLNADKLSISEEDLAEAIRDAERELAEIQLIGNVPLEIELEQSRQKRQNGWTLIRRAWERGEDIQGEVARFAPGLTLGDAYQNRVMESDELSDRLRREAERFSRRASLTALLNQKNQDLVEVRKKISKSNSEQDEMKEKWNALWEPFGIKVQARRPMRSWLLEARALQTRTATFKTKRSECNQNQNDIAAHITALAQLLIESGCVAVPLPKSLSELMVVARRWASNQRELRQEHVRFVKVSEELEIALNDANRQNEMSARNLERWRSEWTAEVSNLGLESEVQTESVLAVFEEWDRLFKFHDAAIALRTRITGIQQEIDFFAGDVQSVADSLKETFVGTPPDIYASSLLDQLNQAKTKKLEKNSLAKKIEDSKRKLAQEQRKVSDAQAVLDKICLQASVQNSDDLEQAEERSKQAKRLRDQVENIVDGIVDSGGGLPLDEIRIQSEKIQIELLPQQLIDLDQQIEALETDRARIQESIGGFREFLEMERGPSIALKASEKMQQTLAVARENIERYIRLKAAQILLKKEIERHRKENQSPILFRASELYAKLTLGSFTGLGTDYDGKDQPVLVGVRPGGKFVTMDGMSDGARDQVYLALRLATLEKYLEAGEPIPFIVDDILIRFDEDRAKVTLEILADISLKTQVLFFTHQTRIKEIALGLGGGNLVNVHPMP